MNKINLFYHLPSTNEYRFSEDALVSPELDMIAHYMGKIVTGDDCITLYFPSLFAKLQIGGEPIEEGRFPLEILSPHGVFYFGSGVFLSDIHFVEKMIVNLEDVMKNPSSYGFEAESL